MNEEEIKKELQKLIFSMNFPLRSSRPVWVWANNKEGGYWRYE